MISVVDNRLHTNFELKGVCQDVPETKKKESFWKNHTVRSCCLGTVKCLGIIALVGVSILILRNFPPELKYA